MIIIVNYNNTRNKWNAPCLKANLRKKEVDVRHFVVARGIHFAVKCPSRLIS